MTKPDVTPDPLLKISKTAEICNVSEKTVWRWIKSGALPAHRLGGQWRVAPKDLNAFLRERWNG